MERIGWVDKISNEEVLAKVEEDRHLMKSTQQRQHHWTGHILRHESLLLDIIEGRMKGRPTRGRIKEVADVTHVCKRWLCGSEVRS